MSICATRRRVSPVVDAISNCAPAAEDRLLDVLPLMVQWLQSDAAWPNPSAGAFI